MTEQDILTADGQRQAKMKQLTADYLAAVKARDQGQIVLDDKEKDANFARNRLTDAKNAVDRTHKALLEYLKEAK
jgi:hypothetical protein